MYGLDMWFCISSIPCFVNHIVRCKTYQSQFCLQYSCCSTLLRGCNLLQAVFLSRLVGPDVAIASAHSSLKSISGSSPGIQLAARHCFLLEDPPDDKKEPVGSGRCVTLSGAYFLWKFLSNFWCHWDFCYRAEIVDRDSQEDGNLEGRNDKEDKSSSVLDDSVLSNNQNEKKIEDSVPDETLNSESTGKVVAAKKQDTIASCEDAEQHRLDETSNSEVQKDHQQSTMKDSGDLTSKVDLPPSSVKESEVTVEETPKPAEAAKDVHSITDSQPAEKKELQQSVSSDSVREAPQPTEAPKDVDMSDSLPSEKHKPEQPVGTNSVEKSPQPTEASTDVDMASDSLVSEKDEPQQPVVTNSVEEPSQPKEAPNDVVMASDSLPSEKNEPSLPVNIKSSGRQWSK